MATPYLIRRRAGYYFRVRVPVDLAPILGTHLTRSLATNDYALARRLAIQAAAAMASVWHGARQRMRFVNGEWLSSWDEKEEFVRRMNALDAAEEIEKKTGAGTDAHVEVSDVKVFTEEHVAEIIKAVRAHEREQMFQPPSATEVARLEGVAEGMRQAIAAGLGTAALVPALVDQPALAEGANRPVSTHLDALFKHQGVGEKTEEEYRTTYRKMVAHIGDKAIGEITETEVIEFFDSIPDTVKPRGGRLQAAAGTQQKHATALKALFGWASNKRLCRSNLAANLKPTKASKKEAIKFERRPFDPDELDRIFSQPLFTGAKSEHFLNKPGKVLIRDHRFYFPLVALLTGARLNELQQALIGDVSLHQGTPYFMITLDIDEDDAATFTPEELQELKRLKTENAKRWIPIHPVLRSLGFMKYVERRRKARPSDSLLFPSAGYGALYNQRIFPNAKAKHPTTSFHSLRHNYKDMVRGLVNNEELQDRLMGHAPKGAGGRYGSPLTREEEKAFFSLSPAVPLVHLYS